MTKTHDVVLVGKRYTSEEILIIMRIYKLCCGRPLISHRITAISHGKCVIVRFVAAQSHDCDTEGRGIATDFRVGRRVTRIDG